MKSRLALQHRDSWESFLTTGNNSVYLPRRVESIMGDEDRKKYELAQANQYNQFIENSKKYAIPPPGQVYEIGDMDVGKSEWDVGKGAVAANTEQPETQRRPRSHGSSNSSYSSRARSPGPATPSVSRGHSSRSARHGVRLQDGSRTGRSPLASSRQDA
jgi:chitin synthase